MAKHRSRTITPAKSNPTGRQRWEEDGLYHADIDPEQTKILCPDHAALSLRRSAYRSLVCHDALGCARALYAHAAAIMSCSRWALMPLACRPKMRPSSNNIHPKDVDLCQYRAHAQAVEQHGRHVRLAPRSRLVLTRNITAGPSGSFIQLLQAWPGLPQDVAGGLVPELQYHPGARAGVGR